MSRDLAVTVGDLVDMPVAVKPGHTIITSTPVFLNSVSENQTGREARACRPRSRIARKEVKIPRGN